MAVCCRDVGIKIQFPQRKILESLFTVYSSLVLPKSCSLPNQLFQIDIQLVFCSWAPNGKNELFLRDIAMYLLLATFLCFGQRKSCLCLNVLERIIVLLCPLELNIFLGCFLSGWYTSLKFKFTQYIIIPKEI